MTDYGQVAEYVLLKDGNEQDKHNAFSQMNKEVLNMKEVI